MKGGNLRGYSALFSIVPGLHLGGYALVIIDYCQHIHMQHFCCYNILLYLHAGLNILFSGSVSKLSVAKEAYATLIPAFVEALTAPPTYPLPPNTTLYTGIYKASWNSGDIAIASIHLHNGSLVLSGSAFSGIFLVYREPFKFQVSMTCYSTL